MKIDVVDPFSQHLVALLVCHGVARYTVISLDERKGPEHPLGKSCTLDPGQKPCSVYQTMRR